MFISSKFMTELSMRKKPLKGSLEKPVEKADKIRVPEADRILEAFKEKGIYDDFLLERDEIRKLDEQQNDSSRLNEFKLIIKYCGLASIEAPQFMINTVNTVRAAVKESE